jgi:hypothetical protein
MSEKQNTLTLDVHVSPEYENKWLKLRRTRQMLNFSLEEGEHVYTSNPVEVGALKNFGKPRLWATVSIWYRYQPEEHQISLCAHDVDAPEAPRIDIREKVSSDVESEDGGLTNAGHLACCENSCIFTDLRHALSGYLKDVTEAFIEELENLGLCIMLRTPVPNISSELYEKLGRVFKDGTFVEFFDPDKTYGPEYVLQDLGSSWGGKLLLGSGDNFANVIGSSGDPSPGRKAWRVLWETATGVKATSCASLGFARNKPGFSCNTSIIMGGHCVKGTQAQKVNYGDDDVAFIIPICVTHNARSHDPDFMSPVSYNTGFWLKNYHNKP